MSTTPTANYGFSKITPGTEKDIWGPIQSSTLDAIDTQIKNRQNEIATKANTSHTHNASDVNAGTLAAARMPALTGDVTSAVNTVATTIANDAVTNAKLANMAANTIKGCIAGGDPVDLTGAQAGSIIGTLPPGPHTHPESDIINLTTDLAAKAPLASPALTGTPTAPTPAAADNTTKLATTAFVTAAIAAAAPSPGGFARKTANYSLVVADAGLVIEMNMAGANTLTIPTNAAQAIPVNTEIHGTQYGAGQTTIAPQDGTVTLRASGGKLKATAQYAAWTMKKVATNEWYVWGDLSA